MDVGKHTHSLLVEVQTAIATMVISTEFLQKKLKIYIPTTGSSDVILSNTAKDSIIPYYRHTCSSTFIAALLTTAWKLYAHQLMTG